jgi:flagellar biosynthesis anti-sigma factor FlgM
MRIDPNQIPGNLQPDNVDQTKNRGAQATDPNATPGSPLFGIEDSFQSSGTLNQVQQLKAQLAQTPDVRSERVAALRQQVQQGTYKPTNEQIANAMVSELGSNNRKQ